MGKHTRYYSGIEHWRNQIAVVVGDDELNIHRRVQFDTLTTERSWQEIINEFLITLTNSSVNFKRRTFRYRNQLWRSAGFI